jgi:hypothetical protein
MNKPNGVPPGLRAMTDQLMTECADLLPHNVNEVRRSLEKYGDQSAVMEEFVVAASMTLTHASQPLTMLCTALLRIIELEDALRAAGWAEER